MIRCVTVSRDGRYEVTVQDENQMVGMFLSIGIFKIPKSEARALLEALHLIFIGV